MKFRKPEDLLNALCAIENSERVVFQAEDLRQTMPGYSFVVNYRPVLEGRHATLWLGANGLELQNSGGHVRLFDTLADAHRAALFLAECR